MKQRAALVALAALLGGCAGGTETGNPSFDAKLTYTAYSSDSSRVSVREPGAPVVVNTVWLILGDVVFDRDAAVCDPTAEGNPRAPGLGVGNHASTTPASTDFSMTAGDYCGADVPFERLAGTALPSEAPPALEENTVVVEGVTADGKSFTIQSNLEASVHLAATGAAGSFPVDAATPRLGVQFDVARWLENVDFSSATAQGDRILVSESENSALHAAFVAGIEPGITVVRDDAASEVLARGGAK